MPMAMATLTPTPTATPARPARRLAAVSNGPHGEGREASPSSRPASTPLQEKHGTHA